MTSIGTVPETAGALSACGISCARSGHPVSGFTHLHCHSTWSLMDGAIPAEALPHAAAALGFDAVALTDHDSLLGAVRFSKACRDAGVKPVYGAELTVRAAPAMTGARQGRDRAPRGRGRAPPGGGRGAPLARRARRRLPDRGLRPPGARRSGAA